ncbi:MAG TPA: flagellar export chaperone FlgN [Thiotrichales bacterium]|nr:flagellar export chaperone FlgN [Thiotrichales bacterium]
MTVCQLCDQWVEQLQAFLLTLESEFDALKSNQADLITQIAERKLSQLDEMSQTEQALKAKLPGMEASQISAYLLTNCTESSAAGRLLTLTK